MKDNSTFDKDFVRYLIWFILGALLICVFPWLFTQTYFHVCDFSEKGQVGDTIGGIMGPFEGPGGDRYLFHGITKSVIINS